MAQQVNRYAVIITSAINTKFGVYTSDERLAQTLATIDSVRTRIPDCKIFLLEISGVSLTATQAKVLTEQVDHLMDFTTDPDVVGLYNSTDNWDVVKNVTEVMCFGTAVKRLSQDTGALADFQRVFKVSGRYTLDERFDIGFYDAYQNQHSMVIGTKQTSQFPFEVTQVEAQYMCRLWSWPTVLNAEVIAAYDNSLRYMYERLAAGGYADIEHCLYKFLDPAKVINRDVMGVVGNIAPNGAPIRN